MKIRDFEVAAEQVEKAERKNTRATCWVGTWNNPKMSDEEFLAFLQTMESDEHLQYACFQREEGEGCKTPHLQFFIVWRNAKYFKWVKDTLPYGCHFKPMISNMTACRNYCMKPDTRTSGPYEVGEFIAKGGRSDIREIMTLIGEGVPLGTVKSLYPTQWTQYSRQFKEHEQYVIRKGQKGKRRVLTVNYVWSSTGAGKTSFFYDNHGADLYRVVHYDNRAFDFYDNEKVILFEEFRSSLKITDMLNYLDVFFVPLPCRFQDKVACYTEANIVSNIPLDKQYESIQSSEPATWQALMRRIHNVYNFDDPSDRARLVAGEPNPNPHYIRRR